MKEQKHQSRCNINENFQLFPLLNSKLRLAIRLTFGSQLLTDTVKRNPTEYYLFNVNVLCRTHLVPTKNNGTPKEGTEDVVLTVACVDKSP